MRVSVVYRKVVEWVPPAGGCEAAKAAATVVVDVLDISVGYLSRLKSILGISPKRCRGWFKATAPVFVSSLNLIDTPFLRRQFLFQPG